MSKKPKITPWIIVTVGIAISTFFLWLALRNVDKKAFLEAFSLADYQHISLCILALSIGIVLRSYRWYEIAGTPKYQRLNFSRATSLGALTNLLIPARAGEIIRVVTLMKLTKSSLSSSITSAFVDRLADMFALLVIASSLFLFTPVGKFLNEWLTIFILIACFIILGIILFNKYFHLFDRLLKKVIRQWATRWSEDSEKFFSSVRDEFQKIFQRIFRLRLFLLIPLIMFADYLAITMILYAFGIILPHEAPLVLWVFLAAGSALPSAPGYVGLYQLAAVWTLSLYSIEPSISAALATMLQLTTLFAMIVTVLLLNITAYAKRSIS